MPTTLYTTNYNEKDAVRRRELLRCLAANALHPFIDWIVVLNEGEPLNGISPKIKEISINQRPLFSDFFRLITQNTTPDDINIIANTDICFDESLHAVKTSLPLDTCMALGRWETYGKNNSLKKPKLNNSNDCQDVWIFQGPIRNATKADFPIGVPRCDNRLLYELQGAGYNVINPAFSIRCIHVHNKPATEYPTVNQRDYVPPPYRYIYPHNLKNLPNTLLYNLTHKPKIAPYKFDSKKLNKLWLVRLARKFYSREKNSFDH